MRRILNNLRAVRLRSERGVVLVIAIMSMGVLLVVSSYALDTAIWYVHARHLQTQADAAAIAGIQQLQYPCVSGTDTNVKTAVNTYDGTGLSPATTATVYNPQVAGKTPATVSATYPTTSSQHDITPEINQPNYAGQTFPSDTSPLTGNALSGSPCTDGLVDVKMTESNVPSFIPSWLNPLSFATASNINKQAQIQIQTVKNASGAEPFVEPLPDPASGTAQLVNESTGATIGSSFPLSELVTGGVADPTTLSGSIALPSTIPTNTPTNGDIGVEFTPANGSTYNSNGTNPPYGITYFHVWTAGTTPPYVDDAWLAPTTTTTCPTSPGSNSPSNFSSSSSANAVQLCVNLVVPSTVTCANLNSTFQLTMNDGANVNLANSACTTTTSGGGTNPNTLTWTFPQFSVTADAGGVGVTLSWQQTSGTFAGNTCKSTGTNPCSGSFGTIQQVYSGAYDSQTAQASGSGTTLTATVANNTGAIISSESKATLASQTITVTIHSQSFASSSSTSNTTPTVLSFGYNQGNAALECNGSSEGSPQFQGNVATGCSSLYQTTTGTCPNSDSPPSCATENPGNGKLNKDLNPGMTARVYCGGVVSGCNVTKCPSTAGTDYNYWTSTNTLNAVLTQKPADPRLIILLVTDNNALGTGATTVPVREFAEFYVTGWYGDPCTPANGGASGGPASNGLNYVADTDPSTASPAECSTNGKAGLPNCSGVLLGHFVTYIAQLGTQTGSGSPCIQTQLQICTPVFTK